MEVNDRNILGIERRHFLTLSSGLVAAIAHGKEVQPTDPFFPYSSQWNAYCPLEQIDITIIDSIKDLEAWSR
jgi:hypothetical protein